MMQIKKILCPTDLSETSYRGIDAAGQMARQYAAKLFLLHVVNGMSIREDRTVYKGKRLAVVSNADRRLLADAHKRLESLAARKVPAEINLGIRVTMGAVDTEIKRMAEDEYVDAVVIATRGYSGWRLLLCGSLAQRLIAQVDCPVISVPCKKTDRYGIFTFRKNSKNPSGNFFNRSKGPF